MRWSRVSTGQPSTRRLDRRKLVWPALLGLAAAAVTGGMLAGHGDLADPKLRDTLLSLRAYRLAAGFLTGAALAVGGVLVQGLFRNPLASPSILGTTAGASFGGQAALLLYQLILSGVLPAFVVPELLLPVGCLLGALCALLISGVRG